MPSGISTDQGARDLRSLFLDRSRWEWLYAFHNRLSIFDIHSNFKFCVLIVQKCGRTKPERTAFMPEDLSAWEETRPDMTPVSGEQMARRSPGNRVFLEINFGRDLRILEEPHGRNPVLGSPDCPSKVAYDREFDMSSDTGSSRPSRSRSPGGTAPTASGAGSGSTGMSCCRSRRAA